MMRQRGQLYSPGWLLIFDSPALSSSAGIMGMYRGTPYSMPFQTAHPFPGVHSYLTLPWTTLTPISMSPPSGRLSHTCSNRLSTKKKGLSYPKSHCYRPASSTFKMVIPRKRKLESRSFIPFLSPPGTCSTKHLLNV